MKIQRVWAVYYSATGCTAQAVETLAKALADTLRVPWQKDEFTTPDQRNTVRYFAPEEIVVFGMPVYAMRSTKCARHCKPMDFIPWLPLQS